VTQEVALATFDTAWSRIARVHYDSTFNGVDWDAVRAELRPRAAAARTNAELRATITEMLERLGESHYGLIPQEVSHALQTPAETAAGGEPGDIGLASWSTWTTRGRPRRRACGPAGSSSASAIVGSRRRWRAWPGWTRRRSGSRARS
jgi:hypothetical protein